MAEFESPLPHSMKPVPVAGFIIYNENSAKSLSRIYFYTKPRIVKGSRGWYITYQYRIPLEVQHLYDNKKWYRFRITEDMNRRRGEDREQYAEYLVQEITRSLQNGYNPFKPELKYLDQQAAGIELPKVMSAREALELFLEKWRMRGLDSATTSRYVRYVSRLMDWLRKKDLLRSDIREIQTNHIETFLQDSHREYEYGNREYNNTYDFIRTAFNFMVKKKIIHENPCLGIDKLKANTNKHRYYDERSLTQITKALQVSDPYCYLAFQTVYYLCVRADKELMNLKVGNVMWEENKILADVGKGGSARYIPMDQNIKELLKAHCEGFPPGHYIFGIDGTPSLKKFSHGFFARRFKKVRDAIGMASHFTLYGAKHTRVIHLKSDGATDSDIMSLTGHKDFVSYAKYLRDLGLAADAAKISMLSRKL